MRSWESIVVTACSLREPKRALPAVPFPRMALAARESAFVTQQRGSEPNIFCWCTFEEFYKYTYPPSCGSGSLSLDKQLWHADILIRLTLA